MRYINFRDNPRIVTLLSLIHENPGIRYNEISKRTGFVNGALSHYLTRMELKKMIRASRKSRGAWFFSFDSPQEEDDIIINLRKETTRKILLYLLQKNSATLSDIASEICRSPSTTSIALSKLQKKEIIRKVLGQNRKYEIQNKDLVIEILQKTNPSLLDKLTDRFADTFSYF